ncbi:MAG: PHP domain-containing protein [Actinobacteria bacterium]|nr:MAG: PHP domain-containing protein [Actinomycetota bacterium]
MQIGFADDEERGALRLFLRALRRLDDDAPFDVVVRSVRGPSSSTPLRAGLRSHVSFIADGDPFAGAHLAVAGSDGARPAPAMLLRAVGAGAVPLAPSLAVYEEVLAEGERGLLFAADDADTMGAQLRRLIEDAPLRERLRAAAEPLRDELRWSHVADRLESVYERVVSRRHPLAGDADLAKRIGGRRTIDVDLHMHTDHSHDCATPVEVLLATARDQGLGAIAVTDHNVVSGAHEAAAKAKDYGVKVIVAEEVKTAHQGEVIGLFIDEQIPRGLTLAETVAEIKRQGGLVYVPHPFDRMHAVPDYEHLLTIIEDIDLMEVYNPRVAIGSFNEEAERFAAKYRILAAAGSDSHVAPGLGSVRVRMRDFDGPHEFLQSLRTAEIVTKPSSLLYVQALKFLETKATPPAARKARRARRVRRATRKG